MIAFGFRLLQHFRQSSRALLFILGKLMRVRRSLVCYYSRRIHNLLMEVVQI
jgi:hypothetical protein